jgi:TonB family protein
VYLTAKSTINLERDVSMSHFKFVAPLLLAVLFCAVDTFAQDETSPPPAKEEIKEAGRNGVSAPKCVYCPPAEYTNKARKDKLAGTVTLMIIVTADGTVRDISVRKGLGDGLDESAVKTVRKWEFKPAVDRDGNPVPVKVAVQVSFHLY